jgi:hypothetical protein
MYSGSVQNEMNRRRIEQELLERVIRAGEAFRDASADAKPAAQKDYAELLAAFGELVMEQYPEAATKCELLNVAGDGSCAS